MLECYGNPKAGQKSGSPAVLLLHAFPLSGEMWEPQFACLEQAGYTVIAPHVYGVEGSPGKSGWSMADYADELASLLDRLECSEATVAGLSMGGYQAFEFYRLHPDKVSSLVLCDTRAVNDSPEAYAQRMEFRRAVEELGSEEAMKRMLPNFFAPRTYTSRPEIVTFAQQLILRQSPGAISEAMRAIAERPDSTGLLRSISCPVLIINGAEDTVTPPATAEAMNEAIPHSVLGIIPDAGHLSNLEQPGRFNTLLLEHLKNL
jgi:non-heme chloroperoxidase